MNFLICCDNQDHSVGHFVQLCADKSVELLSEIGITMERLNTDQLTAQRISELTNRNVDDLFICAAYSHGNESALVNETLGEDYVSVEVNYDSFNNVFFYTWACSTAQNLGPFLTENGCAVYIGHFNNIEVPAPGDDILEIFVECAVYGLQSFYHDGFTAVESLNRMRDYYDEQVDELKDWDPLAASYLQEHSNSLEISGNNDLTYNVLIESV